MYNRFFIPFNSWVVHRFCPIKCECGAWVWVGQLSSCRELKFTLEHLNRKRNFSSRHVKDNGIMRLQHCLAGTSSSERAWAEGPWIILSTYMAELLNQKETLGLDYTSTALVLSLSTLLWSRMTQQRISKSQNKWIASSTWGKNKMDDGHRIVVEQHEHYKFVVVKGEEST